MKHFIAVYTNKIKEYCDDIFFKRLLQIKGNNPVFVIDNTLGTEYYSKLKTKYGNELNIEHIEVKDRTQATLAHENITQSLLALREKFLKSDCDTFTIIETDVIPYNTDTPLQDLESILTEHSELGAVGAIFYAGWHNPYMFNPVFNELVETHHVLSGFTMYRRALIEKYPFRYDKDDLRGFPDAWICKDAIKDWKFADYCGVKCRHLQKNSYSRGLDELK